MKNDILEVQSKAFEEILIQTRHFVVNKLATLRGKQNKLEELIPVLLSNYHTAIKPDSVEKTINPRYLEVIDRIINLEEQIEPIIDYLDSVTHYCELLNQKDNKYAFSAQKCIQEMLKNYPFKNEEERQRIQFNEAKDFQIALAPIFLKTFLEHVLSKALGRRNPLKIEFSLHADFDVVRIEEKGNSFSQSEQEISFQRFLSKQRDKIVPDPGFCQLALVCLGGEIICETRENTLVFKILFPKRRD